MTSFRHCPELRYNRAFGAKRKPVILGPSMSILRRISRSSEVKPSRLYPHHFPRLGFACCYDTQSSFLFIKSPASEQVDCSCSSRFRSAFHPEHGASCPPGFSSSHSPVLVPGVTFLFRCTVQATRAAALRAAEPTLRTGSSTASAGTRPDRRGRKHLKSGGRDVFFRPLLLFLLSSLSRPFGRRASTRKKSVS